MDGADAALIQNRRHFLENAEPEVFQRRNRIRKRQVAMRFVNLEAQAPRFIVLAGIEARVAVTDLVLAVGGITDHDLAHMADIDRGFGRTIVGMVGQRERVGIAPCRSGGARRFERLRQRRLDSL